MERANEGDVVRIRCVGRLTDGQEFELSQGPMEIILGHGDLLKEVEQGLVGMTPGESRLVVVPKGKGFGARDEDRIQVVSRDEFPKNVEPKVGMRLRIPASNYEVIDATVTKVTDSEITLDGNHPLADQDVLLNITLLEIVSF
ncbi:peptidylprolyl isomerase [Planctomycetota bacterium]